jgi:hypothetical protein
LEIILSGLWRALKGRNAFTMGRDWAGYDLTVQAAAEIHKNLKVNPEIYYFSFCTTQHKYSGKGYFWPTLKMHPYLFLLSVAIGRKRTANTVVRDSDWWENDGKTGDCVANFRLDFDIFAEVSSCWNENCARKFCDVLE